MLDHIKSGADFTTTYLTTFRPRLPGDSSTRRTLYQFFRTKKHVLDAISRKKLHPFAWGGWGRKFKSCHSDQKSIENNRFSMLFSCLLRSFWGRATQFVTQFRGKERAEAAHQSFSPRPCVTHFKALGLSFGTGSGGCHTELYNMLHRAAARRGLCIGLGSRASL